MQSANTDHMVRFSYYSSALFYLHHHLKWKNANVMFLCAPLALSSFCSSGFWELLASEF